MFIVTKKFEVNVHEIIDFLRLVGRFGVKFKIGDEYVIEGADNKERFRKIVVFGTRRQIADILEARAIIVEYGRH